MKYQLLFATGLSRVGVEATCATRVLKCDVTSTSSALPIVSLAQSTFRGNTTSPAGYAIEYFRDLRFANLLGASWQFKKREVLTVTNTDSAIQDATTSGATYIDDNDCMFLNVYGPQSGKVPVVV